MAKYSELKSILKSHELRVTDGRMDVLEFFLRSNRALSFKDLEAEFKEYDKVTLYRTLGSFTENGVLHKIPDDTGVINYGLCHHTCAPNEHHHDHCHFKCTECGAIECLEEHIPHIDLPGYKVMEANLILTGVCRNCSN